MSSATSFDKPDFPKIWGVPMFTPNNKVNPQYVAEVMKVVKYRSLDLKSSGSSNNTVVFAAMPDGFSLGMGEAPCVVGTNFDAALGGNMAMKRAVANAEAKVWEMLGILLYFKMSGIALIDE